jgi:hypothetical protein
MAKNGFPDEERLSSGKPFFMKVSKAYSVLHESSRRIAAADEAKFRTSAAQSAAFRRIRANFVRTQSGGSIS